MTIARHDLTTSEKGLLSSLRLFSCLDAKEFCLLTDAMERRTYRKGEVVFRHDDLAGCLYILVAGRVKIRSISPDGRKESTFAWIYPGSFFGTLGILDEGDHQSDAVAVQPSIVLVLGKTDFQDFLRTHPRALEILVAIMTSRWRASMQRFYDYTVLDVRGRLAKVILNLARQGQREGPSASLAGLTQSELASLVGATRESVHKWLHYFARQGWIELRDGGMELLQADEMERVMW